MTPDSSYYPTATAISNFQRPSAVPSRTSVPNRPDRIEPTTRRTGAIIVPTVITHRTAACCRSERNYKRYILRKIIPPTPHIIQDASYSSLSSPPSVKFEGINLPPYAWRESYHGRIGYRFTRGNI